MEWLTGHSFAVQAIVSIVSAGLAGALTWATFVYAGEARKAREAAERSAAAAQESLALLKRQYESQVGLGPARIREALKSTKHLVVYWSEQIAPARYNANALPNPGALIKNDLHGVLDHARNISPELADLIWQVIANLRKAAGEFEKISKGVVYSSGGPGAYLSSADALINAALKKLAEESEEKKSLEQST